MSFIKLKDLCFEIIKKCPNNCLFCSSCSGPNENEIISYELFKKTIDKFIELGGIEELSISGGEPLLHPHILDMIKYAKSRGIKVILFTSGICRNKNKITETEINKISNEHIQRIIKMMNTDSSSISRNTMDILKAIGLDKIVFDLQTIDESNYNQLMGTKQQLPFILESIARATVVGIPTEIHFIPLKINQTDLKDVLEIAELGIDKVNLLRFIPQGRGKDNIESLMLSNEELIRFIQDIDNHSKIRQGIHLQEDDTHKCTAGLGKFIIRYDGKILPCAAFKDCDDTTLEHCGLKPINISDDELNISFSDSTRKKPLCKQFKRIEYKEN